MRTSGDGPPVELVRAWEAVSADGDPLAALRAARQLRDALAGWEVELARRALTDGATWDTIGGTLGISRQAAWQRLRGGIEESIERDRQALRAERDRLSRRKEELWRNRTKPTR